MSSIISPILFVDEKPEQNSDQYRFKQLERKLFNLNGLVEFIGDLELSSSTDEYTDQVDYIPNPILEIRKIVFIHSSLDDPKYPESVVNQAKLAHRNTTFIKFSGDRSSNLRKENLNLPRDQVYNFDKNGFEIYVKFFLKTEKQDYFFFEHGKYAFEAKEKETDRIHARIKSNIKDRKQLASRKLDAYFTSIMRLADIYEDKDRLEKGIEYISSVDDVDKYHLVIDKYVKQIKKTIKSDQDTLNSIL